MLRLTERGPVPVGTFQLRAYGPGGRLVDFVSGENIVVNDGREALARLLGNDSGNWYVDTMKFGDGGHNPIDPTEMIPASITDTDLYGTIHISKDVTSQDTGDPDHTAWPAARQVRFVATVETSEGNGAGSLEYSEAGLYYNSGVTMFAHRSFGYVIKNDTIRLVATWSFVF